MIDSREGVIGLPIKLTISFMILALMVPPILASVENIQESMEQERSYACGTELADILNGLGTKGPDYKIWHQFDIPERSSLVIGGNEGHIIRILVDGEHIGNVLMSRPVIGTETVLSGSVILEISNTSEGVSVREI